MGEETKQNPLLKARAQAVGALIEENEDRFHALYAEKATALGVTYTRPETDEMRAEREIRELFAKHDGLREKVLGSPDGEPVKVDPVPSRESSEQGVPDKVSVDGSTRVG